MAAIETILFHTRTQDAHRVRFHGKIKPSRLREHSPPDL